MIAIGIGCRSGASKEAILSLVAEALEHPAFKWNHLKADKMLEIQKGRASFARKTAHTFAHDALSRAALAEEVAMLFTYEGKRSEAGLIAAADELGIPLHFLSLEALRAMTDRVATRSLAVEKALGIPSVAEASALAGCGFGGHLLLPRITGDGVTCAIAKRIDE